MTPLNHEMWKETKDEAKAVIREDIYVEPPNLS